MADKYVSLRQHPKFILLKIAVFLFSLMITDAGSANAQKIDKTSMLDVHSILLEQRKVLENIVGVLESKNQNQLNTLIEINEKLSDRLDGLEFTVKNQKDHLYQQATTSMAKANDKAAKPVANLSNALFFITVIMGLMGMGGSVVAYLAGKKLFQNLSSQNELSLEKGMNDKFILLQEKIRDEFEQSTNRNIRLAVNKYEIILLRVYDITHHYQERLSAPIKAAIDDSDFVKAFDLLNKKDSFQFRLSQLLSPESGARFDALSFLKNEWSGSEYFPSECGYLLREIRKAALFQSENEHALAADLCAVCGVRYWDD